MNCVDCCRFLIMREKADGAVERTCRLDGRFASGIRKCSAWEEKEPIPQKDDEPRTGKKR